MSVNIKTVFHLLAAYLTASAASASLALATRAQGEAAAMQITQAHLEKFAWSNVYLRVVSEGKLLAIDQCEPDKRAIDEVARLEKALVPVIDIRHGIATNLLETFARKLKPFGQIRLWDVGSGNFLPIPNDAWLKSLRLEGDPRLDCSATNAPLYALLFAICESVKCQLLITQDGHMAFKRADASFEAFNGCVLIEPHKPSLFKTAPDASEWFGNHVEAR